MKKIIFIILIIICASFSFYSQPVPPSKEDTTKQTNTIKGKNWLYGELGGNGGALSVNYERYFSTNLSFRVGLGTGVIAFAASLPIMVNYSYNNLLEFGMGIVPFTGAATGDWRIRFLGGKESGLLLTSVVGFKRINKGFIYKLSLTPFFNPNGSIWGLTGGLSFGFSF